LRLRSRPHWATGGAYSAPQTPYLILGVLLLREVGGGKRRKRERKGRERKGEVKEREAGPYLPLPFPIR